MADLHSFDIAEAKAHGVEKAILLFNLRWWLKKNKANRVNFRAGYYWTYNSGKAFAELFPYLNERSIRRWLQELEDSGVIMSGNYNKSPYDKTKWYTIPSEFEGLGRDDQRSDDHEPLMTTPDPSRLTESGRSITDNKPFSNSDDNTIGSANAEPTVKPDGDGLEKLKNQIPGQADDGGLEARVSDFRKEVFDVGGLIYTSKMLDNFFKTWSQPDQAKRPKMRWEKERAKKGWDLPKRLEKWATNNYDKIQCYLTADEKTIQEKRLSFAKLVESYKSKYDRDFLLEFYRYWSQPEQSDHPQYLRFEKEEFWDLGTRLAARYDQVKNKPTNPTPRYGQRESFIN